MVTIRSEHLETLEAVITTALNIGHSTERRHAHRMGSGNQKITKISLTALCQPRRRPTFAPAPLTSRVPMVAAETDQASPRLSAGR